MIEKKANLFIAGAAKCGTTSLYNILSSHQEVHMSPVKEPNFFSSDIDPSLLRVKLKKELQAEKWEEFISGPMNGTLHTAYVRNEEQYGKLLINSGNEKVLGEASVSYLYSSSAAQNIYKYNPSAKVIIILRQPAERAFSHYLMERRLDLTRNSFIDDFNDDLHSGNRAWGASPLYIPLGLYAEQVKRFTDVFPADQVKIIFFQNFSSDPQSVLEEIYSFLEISHQPYQLAKSNDSLLPRNNLLQVLAGQHRMKVAIKKPLEKLRLKKAVKNIIFKPATGEKITAEEKNYVTTFFRDDIQKLSLIISKDLSLWLNS